MINSIFLCPFELNLGFLYISSLNFFELKVHLSKPGDHDSAFIAKPKRRARAKMKHWIFGNPNDFFI